MDNFLKALEGTLPNVRVGILGSKTSRSTGAKDEPLTNAEVGSFAEFGSGKHTQGISKAKKREYGAMGTPRRSFLRMPLTQFFPQYIEKSGAFNEASAERVIAEGSIVPWLNRMGALGLRCVLDAFDSNGFGTWKPLKQSTLDRKKIKQTLVETQQLRNSQSWDVK